MCVCVHHDLLGVSLSKHHTDKCSCTCKRTSCLHQTERQFIIKPKCVTITVTLMTFENKLYLKVNQQEFPVQDNEGDQYLRVKNKDYSKGGGLTGNE